MGKIVRVQDASGRGPWKPGLSHKWVDAWRSNTPPPIYVEEPRWLHIARDARSRGFKHIGCAVRASQVLQWFSPIEFMRLSEMGYFLVDATGCERLIETPNQVLIANKTHLRNLPLLSLEQVA